MTAKQVHVMIDIETLSTRADAAIVQIAAVVFDPETGELPRNCATAPFNEACMPDETDHIDPRTVGWWAKQKACASVLGALGEDTPSVWEVLHGLEEWFETLVANGLDVVAVWSHGATFDLPILEFAFRRHRSDRPPWAYRSPRDTRTLYALAPGGMPAVEKDPEREHDALYDCEVQVKQVVRALAALRQQAAEAAAYVAEVATEPANTYPIAEAE